MKIAICDDDKKVREQLELLIKQQNTDCEIRTYASGEAMLYGRMDHDIFFLDIELGGVSGIELAREIRRKQEVSCSRCIFIKMAIEKGLLFKLN